MSPKSLIVDEQCRFGLYDHFASPFAFDLLIQSVFLPFGGIRRLRLRALDLLQLLPGMRVLELGCGTGGITRLLLERGMSVTAVDISNQMLARARWRAPQAEFVCKGLQEFEPKGVFDCVLFAFVLHELTTPARRAVLSLARSALSSRGLVGVLDWALPAGKRTLARAWRAFLQTIEPPTVTECLAGNYEADFMISGLQIVGRHSLASGTAQMLVVTRDDASDALC